jgi:hypothetical protein
MVLCEKAGIDGKVLEGEQGEPEKPGEPGEPVEPEKPKGESWSILHLLKPVPTLPCGSAAMARWERIADLVGTTAALLHIQVNASKVFQRGIGLKSLGKLVSIVWEASISGSIHYWIARSPLWFSAMIWLINKGSGARY